ncbi:nuclear transport factor 2 family protein [Desertimonas flava]|uniref:nuclear transport factor 2 family protein n=1 Tax=Desertimonas flava TaxID=2064846 RepID=UPI000E343DE8|nr:nuclear transport factor 2 family protein [Desertimonas flava]
MTTTTDHAPITPIDDRTAVVDALYRFAAGQDDRDPAVLRSAFTDEATLDFTQPAQRFGAAGPVFRGVDEILTILDILEPLVTSHVVTNPQVAVDGDTATMRALVAAQHVRRDDPARHLLLQNVYDLELRRDSDGFRISTMLIRTLWSDGDPTVLFAPPTPGDGLTLTRAGEHRWIDVGDGVSIAALRVVGAGAGSALLRFAPGARSPAHRHPAGEDLYILSGRVRVGDVVLEAGDYLHTPAGGVHDAASEDGALMYISVPEPVEFLPTDAAVDSATAAR